MVGVAVEIDERRRACPPRPRPRTGRRAARSIGEVAVARVDADHHRPLDRAAGEETRQEAERQVVDRLEAEVLERPDRGRAPGPGRSAHDHDMLSRFGSVLPRTPATPCPKPGPCCLSRERRGRSARKWSTRDQDLGYPRPEINSMPTPRYVIVTACGIRAVGAAVEIDRERQRRLRAPSAAAGCRPRAPRSARRSPAGAGRPAPAPRRAIATRSSATSAAPLRDQRQRERGLADFRRSRESARRARRARRRCRGRSENGCANPSSVPSFPSVRCESNRKPNPTSRHTAPRIFAPSRRRSP